MENLKIPAKIEYIDELSQMIERALEPYHLSEKLRNHFMISAEEIFTNIASYGYKETDGQVEIRYHAEKIGDERIIYIQFIDQGIPYNPLEHPKPDFQVPFENRRVGGLGIHMVRELMDVVQYCHKDNSNILTIGKKI